MRSVLTRAFSAALSATLLGESRCPECGRVTLAPGLCAHCRAEAKPLLADEPCPGCGEFPPVPQAHGILCGACRVKPRPWGRVVVCGRYGGDLRALLLAYKFSRRLDLGRRLAGLAVAAVARAVAQCPELAGVEGLAPVPLHRRRLLWRGYNQSRELCRLIAAGMEIAPGARRPAVWSGALARVRSTTPQMLLAREARRTNIAGAFSADARVVADRSVLLVDDIMTTGATLEECARALLAAGAVRVDVLALARA